MNNYRDELSLMTGRPLRIVDPVEFAGPVTFEELSETPLEFVPAGTTTPSVLNLERLKFTNTSPTTITDFRDGQEGQYIIVVGDGQTSVQHGTRIFNTAGTNITLANGRVYAYVKVEGVWREQGGTPVPTIAFNSSSLGANADITTPGEFVVGGTLNLPSGTWLLQAQLSVRVNSTTAAVVVGRITNTTTSTVLSSGESSPRTSNPNHTHITLIAIVGLSSTSTITCSASCTVPATLQAVTTNYASSNTATQLTALRIA